MPSAPTVPALPQRTAQPLTTKTADGATVRARLRGAVEKTVAKAGAVVREHKNRLVARTKADDDSLGKLVGRHGGAFKAAGFWGLANGSRIGAWMKAETDNVLKPGRVGLVAALLARGLGIDHGIKGRLRGAVTGTIVAEGIVLLHDFAENVPDALQVAWAKLKSGANDTQSLPAGTKGVSGVGDTEKNPIPGTRTES